MPGTTKAIVVGVDGYAFNPLSSAVNDAVAFRDALVEPLEGEQVGLVEPSDVTLLAAPRDGESMPVGAQLATRAAIERALKPYYTGDLHAERLIVYFAGHGMVATSADRRGRESIILPVDVSSTDDGRDMLCLDELLRLFSERGPMQQLWIVDACRNMPYEKRPRGYDLSWTEESPLSLRAQVAIFAVSPGGEAPAERGGQGQFTRHLIKGLRGDGCATDYVLGEGYAVTAQSLHEYVAKRVEEGLKGWDEWTRSIQRPDIRPSGPSLQLLRRVRDPAPRDFAVDIRPPDAVGAVDVALEIQAGIRVPGWPSQAPPRRYELKATLLAGMDREGWGQPTPESRVVDLREEDSAIIDVPRADAEGIATRSGHLKAHMGESLFTSQFLSTPASGSKPDSKKAYLSVQAADAPTRIHARRIEYPWTEMKGLLPNKEIELEPGTWEVQARIGDEVLSTERLILSGGQSRQLSLQAQVTPVLAELLPRTAFESDVPETVRPSESIGPMQAAILPTLLPLLAIKPYDYARQILRQFDHLNIPLLDPFFLWAPWDGASVAIAFEGERPEVPYTAEIEMSRFAWFSTDGALSIQNVLVPPDRTTVSIQLPKCRVDIAAPKMSEGITAIALIVRPDGRVQSSISVFRRPLGRIWPQPYFDDPHLKPELISRAIALAVPLYRAGADLRDYDHRFLSEFASAKWIDPVMGALAFHSGRRQLLAANRGKHSDSTGQLHGLLEEIQRNMVSFFEELPDSRVIGALHEDRNRQRESMAALLRDNSLGQPVLSASLFALADAALDLDMKEHWAVDRADRIEPGEVFNQIVTPWDQGSRNA